MPGECHAHVIMDGKNYKEAIGLHKKGVVDEVIHRCFEGYQKAGITFIRDGGDALGVSARAKKLAESYGIDYRSPLFAIHKRGHYGGIVGLSFENMREYAALAKKVAESGGDFIKIMVSGLIDFQEYGKLTEAGLAPAEIREMIHIAHEEGMSVMAHCNGAGTMLAAAAAGVESIEHGAYGAAEDFAAMLEEGVIWTPTIAPAANMLGCGRFPDEVLERLVENQSRNITDFYEKGGAVALGSDAGAYLVPHVKGTEDEYRYLTALVPVKALERTEALVKEKFIRHG